MVRPSTGTRQVAAGGDRAAAPRRDRHTRTQPRLAQSAEHSPGDHLWAGRGGGRRHPNRHVTTPLVRRGQGTSEQHSEGEGGREVVMGEVRCPQQMLAGLGWAPWRCTAQVPAAAWPPLLSSD